MNDWKKDRINTALNGTNPTVLAKMKSGFAVFGDTQFLPGYCVLLAYPQTNSLNDLTLKERSEFLTDMTLIGDAISQVYHPLRINYDILGNTDAFLHAHIFPRYEYEEEKYKTKPVWLYDPSNWSNPEFQFKQDKYQEKRLALQKKLIELIDSYKIY
ncbi:hypothetical protein NSA47_13850 [Irregularibacter muris]|uniref:HIT domain-containing protein n=1 Tax=Irregularibacter muris TaxID=1796619 RepID=A0AAE3L4G8_9FIRM|nr:hypothetical protein [Irregularibacter muris]MCR1900048.1 hypothetical protein [Irregularibacter muris]